MHKVCSLMNFINELKIFYEREKKLSRSKARSFHPIEVEKLKLILSLIRNLKNMKSNLSFYHRSIKVEKSF